MGKTSEYYIDLCNANPRPEWMDQMEYDQMIEAKFHEEENITKFQNNLKKKNENK